MDPETIHPFPDIAEFRLYSGGWLQLSDKPDRINSGVAILRLDTDDLFHEYIRLKSIPVAVQAIQNIEKLKSFFEFVAPDENKLSFYQLPGQNK